MSLFGPGGVVSPRQAAHVQGGDPGRVLADLLAFYSAFSFHPRTEEPPDHVSVEAGFLGYLRLKEAYAAARGNQDAEEVTAEAARRFCRDHLCGHVRALAAKLESVGGARPLSLALCALMRQLASLKTDGSGGGKLGTARIAGP